MSWRQKVERGGGQHIGQEHYKEEVRGKGVL